MHMLRLSPAWQEHKEAKDIWSMSIFTHTPLPMPTCSTILRWTLAPAEPNVQSNSIDITHHLTDILP